MCGKRKGTVAKEVPKSLDGQRTGASGSSYKAAPGDAFRIFSFGLRRGVPRRGVAFA